MDFQLLIVRGRGASTTVKLADGVTTVGRQDDCQLRIKSSQVSRKHCELFEKKGLLLVKDLGSSNGTFVNGKRIQEQRVLEPGDELSIGQLLFKVAKVGEAPPKAPTAPPLKPGDTAVVEAIPAVEDDEFEIEFDVDVPSVETIPTVDEVASAPADPELEAKTEPKPKPEPTPPSRTPAEPDKLLGDDAIADFLLDIKFDED
ncbi:FHA domain-containing protein [Singulisphaera sp. GP187]|uniref:FHA domain-containing protein n=1 Tax=Singulisphaera sp. GP187 TaxID=1882752 RepID=UPI00092A2E92|nr:FHA domain-containing protein [Singulisphaera sp. GP187]SIO61205.1 FHA domain-containing protein [Singulisphaera sp. GP187]